MKRLLLRRAVGAVLAAILLGGGRCSCTTTGTAGPTATGTSPTATPRPGTPGLPTATPTPSIPVKAFFSKHPQSDSDPSKVFSVGRTAHSLAVATFATQQLLIGPTAAESAA